MKRALITGLALTGLVIAPAFAAESMSTDGITMADHAPAKLKIVKNEPSDMAASKLIGLDVYNNQNAEVGSIKDLLFKNGKDLAGIVVSVGGFLGVGESYVLVDPSSLVVSNKDGKLKGYVDTDKDTLKKEPQFTYNAKQKS